MKRSQTPPSLRPGENPYAPGAGSPPPALRGREQEEKVIRVLLERASAGRPYRSMLMTGLRGVGKTVLLNRFEEMANNAKWATSFKEISGDPRNVEDFRAVMANACRRAVLEMDRSRRIGERAHGLLRLIASFRPVASINASGQPEFSIGIDPLPGVADSGNLAEDLTDVFLELGSVAREHKTGALFLLDEVQHLSGPDLSALIMALHRVSQKALPVAVVAAGLPNLPKLASEIQTYTERLFETASIGQLAVGAAKAAITDPAEKLGVHYSEPALEAVLTLTDRWPYFLQEWGQKIWDTAQTTLITVEDVQRATALAQRELDKGFFSMRYDRSSPGREREYMTALAKLSVGSRTTTAITEKLGGNAKSWSMHRARLMRKGLIFSAGINQIDFTIPHFDSYILRREESLANQS